MIFKKIRVGKKILKAFSTKLGQKNLIVICGSRGYVMCGYLNLQAANKFGDAAVKITKVSTLKEALATKVHSASYAAKKLGIKNGQPIKDVLKIIA